MILLNIWEDYYLDRKERNFKGGYYRCIDMDRRLIHLRRKFKFMGLRHF